MLATLTALAVLAPADPHCAAPMSRPVRTLFVALVALSAWLMAGSAFAAAPLCDDRGASALAPPPTLDTPNASIDVGSGSEACGFVTDNGMSLHQGRAHDPLPAPAGADLLPVDTQTGILRAPVSAVGHDFVGSQGHAGVRGRLERPPR